MIAVWRRAGVSARTDVASDRSCALDPSGISAAADRRARWRPPADRASETGGTAETGGADRVRAPAVGGRARWRPERVVTAPPVHVARHGKSRLVLPPITVSLAESLPGHPLSRGSRDTPLFVPGTDTTGDSCRQSAAVPAWSSPSDGTPGGCHRWDGYISVHRMWTSHSALTCIDAHPSTRYPQRYPPVPLLTRHGAGIVGNRARQARRALSITQSYESRRVLHAKIVPPA